MITCLCLQTLEFPPAARCKRARKAPRLTIFSSIGPSFPGEVEHDAKARDGQDIESPLAAVPVGANPQVIPCKEQSDLHAASMTRRSPTSKRYRSEERRVGKGCVTT